MNSKSMPDRQSTRLSGYDYTQAGAYFITLVTEGRINRFGAISNGEMQLNLVGQMILREWQGLPSHIPDLAMDAFVVMPNHVHGILFIGGTETTKLNIKSLGAIIRLFKSLTTPRFHRLSNCGEALWQRNYYDHIVRNTAELEDIYRYIITNPIQWALDHENLDRVIK